MAGIEREAAREQVREHVTQTLDLWRRAAPC
jgi:hypothetical protein